MSTEQVPKSKESEVAKKVESKISEVAEDMESKMEERDEGRSEHQRIEQQDLNQGIDTGTHDSTRSGVNWPASFKTHPMEEKPKDVPEQAKKNSA
jgi:hypothetical protein